VLISLRQTATEMERLQALVRATSEAYKLCIRSAAQYAVELDAEEARGFRERLETLAKSYAEEEERIRLIQSSFRGELREYRDLSAAQIERLRREVEAGAAAMAAFAGSITSHGANHEAKVKGELAHLRDISAWNDPGEMRRGIQGVAAAIESALEQIQSANRMAILQLQDELRMLHQEIESKRRAMITDAATGAWNRPKTEERLQELLQERDAFVAVLVRVKNYRRAQGRFPQRVVEDALKALLKRLRGVIGGDAPVGRLDEDRFLALPDTDPAETVALAREAAVSLSNEYSVQDAGFARSLSLEVATGVCERPAGMEAAAFLKRLEQLWGALGGG